VAAPAGPVVAGADVVELLLQAVAIRAATARKDAKRFISIPFPLSPTREPAATAPCGAMGSSVMAAKTAHLV
jgi:hypothetical protein